MALKVLLNIFYNIAIITLFLSGIWCVNHKQYLILIPVVAAVALIIFLKMRLVKQVKMLTRKP